MCDESRAGARSPPQEAALLLARAEFGPGCGSVGDTRGALCHDWRDAGRTGSRSMRRFAVSLIVWTTLLGGLLTNVACAFGSCTDCCPGEPRDADWTPNRLPRCPEGALCDSSLTPAAVASVHLQCVRPESRSFPPSPAPVAPTTAASGEFHTPRLVGAASGSTPASVESGSLTYLRTARLRL